MAAWASWVINLLVVEWFLLRNEPARPLRPAGALNTDHES
jgi:hypothetical protein